MPALPQQMSLSASGTSVTPGIDLKQRARLGADALRVRQVTGVVIGDAQRHRLRAAPAGGRSRERLGDVADLRRESRGPRGPLRVVRQQLAVLLHRRAAAGRVHHDLSTGWAALRTPRSAARAKARASSSCAGVQRERAAAALAGRRDDVAALGGEHPGGRGVDVAEEHALDAAGEQPDALTPLRAACRRELRRSGAPRRVRPAQARSAGCADAAAAAPSASRNGGRHGRRPAAAASRRSRAGYGSTANSSRRNSALGQRPLVMALDGRARLLDERRVADAGRTGRFAGHAAEAGVEMCRRPARSMRDAGPRRRPASGRCGRAASPSPDRAAGSSDRSAGRSRSGRTCPSAARAARAWRTRGVHQAAGSASGIQDVVRIEPRLDGAHQRPAAGQLAPHVDAVLQRRRRRHDDRRPAAPAQRATASRRAIRRGSSAGVDPQVEDAERAPGQPASEATGADSSSSGRLSVGSTLALTSMSAGAVAPHGAFVAGPHRALLVGRRRTDRLGAACPAQCARSRRPACRRRARSISKRISRRCGRRFDLDRGGRGRRRGNRQRQLGAGARIPATVATTVRETGAQRRQLERRAGDDRQRATDPQSSRARSYPATFFTTLPPAWATTPSARTISTPMIRSRGAPCLWRRGPLSLVATMPPMVARSAAGGSSGSH